MTRPAGRYSWDEILDASAEANRRYGYWMPQGWIDCLNAALRAADSRNIDAPSRNLREGHDGAEGIEINGEPDVTEADAIEYAMGECGMTERGWCSLAGTEYCDFECPFR